MCRVIKRIMDKQRVVSSFMIISRSRKISQCYILKQKVYPALINIEKRRNGSVVYRSIEFERYTKLNILF